MDAEITSVAFRGAKRKTCTIKEDVDAGSLHVRPVKKAKKDYAAALDLKRKMSF